MEILLRKDGKLIVGEQSENRPKVYMARVGKDGRVFKMVYNDEIYWHSDANVWKDGGKFVELEYVGNIELYEKLHFVYKIDSNNCLYIRCDLQYAGDYVVSRLKGFELYGDRWYIDSIFDQYVILRNGMTEVYATVNLDNKEFLLFNEKICLERIKEAIRENLLAELKMLGNLNVKYLKNCNLAKALSDKKCSVSLRNLVALLKKDKVQESLVARESIPVMNLLGAIRLVNKVEANSKLQNVDIEIYKESEDVVIVHKGKHDIYRFGCKGIAGMVCDDYEVEEGYLMYICRSHSLARELKDWELEKWAEVLKVIGKDKIKLD